MIKVCIVGAGRAGSSLLDIFLSNGAVKTVGVTDRDGNAPGLEIAGREGIFVAGNIDELCTQAPDIIVNVTGDRELGRSIAEKVPPDIEVIGETGAKLLLGLVERYRKGQREVALQNDLKAPNTGLDDKVIEKTRELEKMNLELERANRIKARFISNISHELRTPLNSILGFSEILLDKTFGELNEKQARHLSNISASGKHLLQLVNNILDLAKIESGKLELIYDSFDLKEAVDEVVMIMGTPEGGSVGIRAEGPANTDRRLPWALNGQHFLKVTVWDKGIGIREEDMDRIFEEFEQADPSMSRNFQGTGLGLSLTKRLVDLHGGRITVTSRYGEGSEFIFYLPVVSERKREEICDFTPAARTYPWLKEEAPLVLVVEDDIPTSEILTIHLSKAGYKVARAYDGIEAISKARELKPFAIALDVMLPRKDGWEVLQDLKTDPETNDIPVLIHSIVDNQDLAYTLGASDYLLKPVDRSVLLGKLGELAACKDKRDLVIHLKDLEVVHPKRAGLVDELTELFNHRYFQLRLAQEVSRSVRYRIPLSLILIDVDDFSVYTKLNGDYRGNLALKKIAELLKKNARSADVVVRYGGDAFCVILPNTALSSGVVLGRRFGALIRDHPFQGEEAQPLGRITASAGVASLEDGPPEELIRGAEEALAAAVRKGGGNLEVFSRE
ncbi:MAG: diguanylate cyclase [Candidatus Sulfobium sp.]